jgi:DNA-binding CsgD family transcriptional regulator/tetratricopeptide (TPR) repeat protein
MLSDTGSRLLVEAASMISSPVCCTDFIGRREELAFLAGKFRDAKEGVGSFCLVVGDAGIGKTRLVAELRKLIVAEGAQFAVGRCLEDIQAPYTPFQEIFDNLFLERGSAPSSVSISFQKLKTPDSIVALADQGRDSLAKLREFATIARRFRHKSSDSALVMVIEDAHWADAASLELLEYLQRELTSGSVQIVLTSRPEVTRHQHPAWESLTRMTRAGASIIKVRAMTEGEIRQLAEDALDGRKLPVDRLDRVLELAEGNPLFAEELLRSELDGGTGEGDEFGLTTLSVQGIVIRRYNRLSPQGRRIIMHAAALGRDFDPSFLAHIVSQPLKAVLLLLRRSRDIQLINESRISPGRFAFRHALTREIIYQQLLAAEAKELHTKIAALLEESPDTPTRLSELAYQWSAACEPVKAAHYNELAGDAAFGVFAYNDAARFYRRAFNFEPTPGERRARLCEKLAYSLYVGGYSDDTREWFDRALTEYGALGSTEKMAQMLLYIARQCWNDADTQAGFPMAARALELLETTPRSRLKSYAQVMMATYCAVLGQADEALRHLEVLRTHPSARKPEIAGRTYDSRAVALAFQGNVSQSLVNFHKAVKMAQRSGDADLIVRVCSNFANYAMWLGKAALATECWSQALTAAQEKRLTGRTAYTSLGFAWTELWLGKLDHARDLVDQALATGVDNASVRILKAAVGVPLGLMLQDEALTQRCADAEAIELAFRSTEAQRVGPVVSAFVEFFMAHGRTEEARVLLHRGIIAVTTADQSWWLLTQAAMQAEPIYYARARLALEKAAENPQHVVAAAHLKLFDAIVAKRENKSEETAAKASEAAELFAQIGWPYCRAMAEEVAGDQTSALTIYSSIGDRRDQERLESILGPRHRRGRSGTTLTPREREVVAQVTAGKSNREIASALVISERTVEHHLESIFNRLGIRSRAQLIALGFGGLVQAAPKLPTDSPRITRHV